MKTLSKVVSGFVLCSNLLIGCADQNTRRIDMFRNRMGLPEYFDKEDSTNYYEKKFYKEMRKVCASICLMGRYNPKGTDGLYVDSKDANRLLEMYGWEESE